MKVGRTQCPPINRLESRRTRVWTDCSRVWWRCGDRSTPVCPVNFRSTLVTWLLPKTPQPRLIIRPLWWRWPTGSTHWTTKRLLSSIEGSMETCKTRLIIIIYSSSNNNCNNNSNNSHTNNNNSHNNSTNNCNLNKNQVEWNLQQMTCRRSIYPNNNNSNSSSSNNNNNPCVQDLPCRRRHTIRTDHRWKVWRWGTRKTCLLAVGRVTWCVGSARSRSRARVRWTSTFEVTRRSGPTNAPSVTGRSPPKATWSSTSARPIRCWAINWEPSINRVWPTSPIAPRPPRRHRRTEPPRWWARQLQQQQRQHRRWQLGEESDQRQ